MDIVVNDPYVARFNRMKYPVTGEDWELGQWQGGKWKSLQCRSDGSVCAVQCGSE